MAGRVLAESFSEHKPGESESSAKIKLTPQVNGHVRRVKASLKGFIPAPVGFLRKLRASVVIT